MPAPKPPTPRPPTLAAEIGKRAAFESPEQEAYLSLLRTASVLAGPFERLFESRGLSESTYNALRILRGAGDEGRLCGEIGPMLIARVPDVTRLVDRLERAGLAERRKADADRRAVRVFISRKGLKVLAELDEPLAALHREQLAHMTRKQLAELIRLLAAARSPDTEKPACP